MRCLCLGLSIDQIPGLPVGQVGAFPSPVAVSQAIPQRTFEAIKIAVSQPAVRRWVFGFIKSLSGALERQKRDLGWSFQISPLFELATTHDLLEEGCCSSASSARFLTLLRVTIMVILEARSKVVLTIT